MNLSFSHLFQAVGTWLVLIVLFTGCGPDDSDSHHDDSHSHEHAHDHGHQHGEPILGGQMVEVGHTHNPDGLLFYFAEILPSQNDSIRFHLSVEDEAGTSKPAVSKEPDIMAYVTDEEHQGAARKKGTLSIWKRARRYLCQFFRLPCQRNSKLGHPSPW